jgi:hypothetical protein
MIAISGGLTAGDVLSFAPVGAITIASNTGGVLTLTGTDTLANYTAALKTVKFNSTSDDPTATSTRRVITWTVTDANRDGTGAQTSPWAISFINITPTINVTSGYVFIDFGSNGFWRWSEATGFLKLNPADVGGFSVGADGFVYIDFGANGLWRLSDGTGYEKIHPANVENLQVGPDGFVYIDFGNDGFWRFSPATGAFLRLHPDNVESFSVGYDGFVYIDFGAYGLWRCLSDGTGFLKIHAANVEGMFAGPDNFLYIDFGNDGLYRWTLATGFQFMSWLNPQQIDA